MGGTQVPFQGFKSVRKWWEGRKNAQIVRRYDVQETGLYLRLGGMFLAG